MPIQRGDIYFVNLNPVQGREQPGQHFDLALHEQPGVGRQEPRDADRRGVGSMRRPERVVDVDVGV